MGSFMSRARGSLVQRPLQRFDLERRTEKLLGHDKTPVASPKHASDVEALDKQRLENPDLSDEMHNKDDQLLQRLTQVYVRSSDPRPSGPASADEPVEVSPSSRPLPARGSHFVHSSRPFDISQSTGIQGKLPLAELERVLNEHQKNPRGDFSAENISDKYRVSVNNAFNLVRFFGIFNVFQQQKDMSPEAVKKRELEMKRKTDHLIPGEDWVRDEVSNKVTDTSTKKISDK